MKLLKKPGLKAPKKNSARRVLACDFDLSRLILLEALQTDGQLRVEKFDLIRITEDSGRAAETIKSCHAKGYSPNRIRVSLKGQSAVVRFVQMPRMKAEELKSALTYEAENYIPFKLDEVLLDFHILDEAPADGQGMLNLILVAVKKDEIYSVIKMFQDANLNVELIDIDTLAAVNVFEYLYPDESKGVVGLFDMGEEISSLTVMMEGKPRFMRDLSFGRIDIVKRLRRKLGLSDADAQAVLANNVEISPEVREVLSECYENLCSDLKVTLEYYRGHLPDGKPIEKLYLIGGVSDSGFLLETLGAALSVPAEEVDISRKVMISSEIDKSQFEQNKRLLPIALGLCLRQL